MCLVETMKINYVRCNQAAFVSKNIEKAIAARARLLNEFRQGRTKL